MMIDPRHAIARVVLLLRAVLRPWRHHRGGGIAMGFAISLPVLIGALGIASDYAMLTKLRGDLQAAADAAALAGAREIPLAQSNTAQITGAVQSFAAFQLTKNSAATAEDLTALHLLVDVDVAEDFSAVEVTVTEAWTPFFVHFIAKDITPVTVRATARYVGRNNICVLGLANSGSAVFLDKSARLTGNNCGVFSNSGDANGFKAANNAVLNATIVCSAGGAMLSAGASVTPAPITDCPPLEDPLASRQAPTVGGCNYTATHITSEMRTLDPGVYCGGVVIDGTSTVSLNPGVYIIKDGGLVIAGRATLSGVGVGFFLTGAVIPTKFGLNTHISLSAPSDGPLSGLLIFEDRSVAGNLRHSISSDDARTLIGTIYLPRGNLVVDAKEPVADQSAYTAIVAQNVELNMGPNLVLNADYDMTDVPVPAGVAGSSQVILSN
jgi:Flp pilus assembly protein TadG